MSDGQMEHAVALSHLHNLINLVGADPQGETVARPSHSCDWMK